MVPEILDRKGILYNNHPNKFVDSWMFDTEIHLGNEKRTTRGGVGIALMYLRNVEEISSLDSLFGYSNRFDGLGIYLNTILRQDNRGMLVSPISVFVNDGENLVNAFSNNK